MKSRSFEKLVKYLGQMISISRVIVKFYSLKLGIFVMHAPFLARLNPWPKLRILYTNIFLRQNIKIQLIMKAATNNF